MSDNPFQAPQSAIQPPSSGNFSAGPVQTAPIWLTLAAIFSMVLGFLGFFGNCLGLGASVFALVVAPVKSDDSFQMRAQGNIDMAINIIFMALALPLAVGLFVYSIGVLNRKVWGLRGLTLFSLLGCAFVVSRLAVSVPVFVLSMRNTINQENVDAEVMSTGIAIFLISLVLNILIATVLSIFYYYNYRYLKRDEIRALFPDLPSSAR